MRTTQTRLQDDGISSHLIFFRECDILLRFVTSFAPGRTFPIFLNVKVTNEPDNREHANAIRREIKNRIWNVQHQQIVQHNGGNLPVTIMWTMSNVGNRSAYYYAVTLPYIDEIVGRHTRLMLSEVFNAIRGQHPEYGQQWGIVYLVTKPLALLQAMPQEDLQPPPSPIGGINLVDIQDPNQEDEG